MLDLSNISLISICDKNYVPQTLKSMRYCLNNCSFKNATIITDFNDDTLSDKEITFNYLNQKIDKIAYSKFCINDLHKYVDGEFCLIVQWDGFIVNTSFWDWSFLEYDYIGAPWGFDEDCHNRVGNGGFSLRSKKFLEAVSIIDYNPYRCKVYTPLQQWSIIPEDWFLCYDQYSFLKNSGIKFADVNLASKFSVEYSNNIKRYNKEDLSTYNSFGFHGDFNTAAMKLLEGVL